MGFGNRIGVCAGLAEAGIGFVGELNVCGISMLSGNAGADAVRDWLGGVDYGMLLFAMGYCSVL